MLIDMQRLDKHRAPTERGNSDRCRKLSKIVWATVVGALAPPEARICLLTRQTDESIKDAVTIGRYRQFGHRIAKFADA